MKIIKRSGEEQEFDIEKIVSAISRANLEVDKKDRLSDEKIREIATEVEKTCKSRKRASTVEEIQDLVEIPFATCTNPVIICVT